MVREIYALSMAISDEKRVKGCKKSVKNINFSSICVCRHAILGWKDCRKTSTTYVMTVPLSCTIYPTVTAHIHLLDSDYNQD